MKHVTVILTSHGEYIGRLDDSVEDAATADLEAPLKVAVVSTQNGPMMTLAPVSHLLNLEVLSLQAHHILAYGQPPKHIEDKYLELVSGIALASKPSSIITG